jgi:hypothetical protein
MCEPSGPIENGITYIVRPRMQPANRPFSVERICAGSIQLLVGPASCAVSVQMKVRSSTRATSDGSDQRQEGIRPLGRVQLPQRAGANHLLAQALGFLRRAVAPQDAVGLRQAGDRARPTGISFLCLT